MPAAKLLARLVADSGLARSCHQRRSPCRSGQLVRSANSPRSPGTSMALSPRMHALRIASRDPPNKTCVVLVDPKVRLTADHAGRRAVRLTADHAGRRAVRLAPDHAGRRAVRFLPSAWRRPSTVRQARRSRNGIRSTAVYTGFVAGLSTNRTCGFPASGFRTRTQASPSMAVCQRRGGRDYGFAVATTGTAWRLDPEERDHIDPGTDPRSVIRPQIPFELA